MGRTNPVNVITGVVVGLLSSAVAIAVGVLVVNGPSTPDADLSATRGLGTLPTYTPPSRSAAPSRTPSTTTTAPTSTTTTSSTTTTTTAAPDDEGAAKVALDEQVARDSAAAEALVGRWSPQLSSKKVGTVAGGTTYGYREIWADFENLRATYPEVLLLWSGNYSSYTAADYWVTVMPYPTDSGESANAWCDTRGIPADGCYAKLLRHTGGPEGTSKPRN